MVESCIKFKLLDAILTSSSNQFCPTLTVSKAKKNGKSDLYSNFCSNVTWATDTLSATQVSCDNFLNFRG